MNIITQFYKDLLKKRIISKIHDISYNLADNIVNNIFNTDTYKYMNLISSFQSNTYELIRNYYYWNFWRNW